MERADAIDAAIVELAGDLDTTTTSLLEQLGTTQQGLEGKISALETGLQADIGAVTTAVSELETNLLAKIKANQDDGMERADAIDAAIVELAGDLDTTTTSLLGQLDTTQEGLEGKISDLETEVGEVSTAVSDLETNLLAKIKDNQDDGMERADAIDSAIVDLATDLETTEENLLGEIGTTKEQLSAEIGGVSGQVAELSSEVQEVATLFGRDANLLTQEEVDLAQSFLDAAEFEYNALYDVDKSGTFDVADTALMQSAVDSGDYSGFVDSEFGPATGMVARQQERDAAAEALRRDQELEYQAELEARDEQNRQNQIARDAALRADFQRDLAEQADEEKREEFARALNASGREVTEQQAPLMDIGYIYDFGGDSIFANQQQQRFFDSASAYGDNFLTDIITPQQRRAKGGMIKDTTDEILKIIGDK